MKLPLQPTFMPPIVVVMAALCAAFLVVAPPAEAATAAEPMTGQSRPVADFEAIALAGPIKLEVRQTGKESLTLQADAKVLPLIETVVDSGSAGRTLHIRIKRGESVRWRGEIKAVVEVIRLESLTSSGAGDVTVVNLKTPRLKLSVAGAGDARLQGLDTDVLEIRIAGSGDVHAAGSARQVKLGIAGSGDAALAELAADDVSVSIAGSGDAQVTAHKSLTASVAGSGDIRYSGRATAVRTSVAGSGTITRR